MTSPVSQHFEVDDLIAFLVSPRFSRWRLSGALRFLTAGVEQSVNMRTVRIFIRYSDCIGADRGALHLTHEVRVQLDTADLGRISSAE